MIHCPTCDRPFYSDAQVRSHQQMDHGASPRVPAHWNENGFLEIDLRDHEAARRELQELLAKERGKASSTCAPGMANGATERGKVS